MRAITLVKRYEFEFSGNVVKNALTLGDVDNDGSNELVVGNQTGDLCIYKGHEKIQHLSKLGPISCVCVGDVMNQGKNILIIITADGWCFLYSLNDSSMKESLTADVGFEQVDGQIFSSNNSNSFGQTNSNPGTPKSLKDESKYRPQLICFHIQRIPANTKCILLGDIDGDGMTEMVLGLTDRVVRSYRWISNPQKSKLNPIDTNTLSSDLSDKLLGKFIALNKWECANQIGSITVHHSSDGKVALLIAQPGGTFMRIKCQLDEPVSECLEESGQNNDGSSTGENISAVDYQVLGISRMRNPNISTEILGDLQSSDSNKNDSSQSVPKGPSYALATLDGTIMLVQDEIILWAFAVDHQIFALTKLDVTGNGSDDIVVCSWDGQTYILDQEKNSARFHLDEAVQAFECGYYGVKDQEPDVKAFVYVTFKNTEGVLALVKYGEVGVCIWPTTASVLIVDYPKILLYYDVTLKELTCEKFDPKKSSIDFDDVRKTIEGFKQKTTKEIIETLLYDM